MPLPLSELLKFGLNNESQKEKQEKVRREAMADKIRDRTDLPPIPRILTDAWMHQRQSYYFAVMLWTGQTPEEHIIGVENAATTQD